LSKSEEIDEDLRFCCHLILRQLFKILDDHHKDNRRFLSDLVFTLTMVFKSKGCNIVRNQFGANREGSDFEKEPSMSKDQLHRILSDRGTLKGGAELQDGNFNSQ
jgi:hypothetical protein